MAYQAICDSEVQPGNQPSGYGRSVDKVSHQGQQLESLQQRVEVAETPLRNNRVDVRLETEYHPNNIRGNQKQGKLAECYKECKKLEKLATAFCRNMGLEQQQPAKKLLDAILQSKAQQPLDFRLANMEPDAPQKPILDKRIMMLSFNVVPPGPFAGGVGYVAGVWPIVPSVLVTSPPR